MSESRLPPVVADDRLRRLRSSGAVLGATGLAAASGSAALVALLTSPATAVTTITVDTTADGAATASDCAPVPVAGSCSLRDALAAASSGDTIVFSPTAFAPGSLHTITLDAAEGHLTSTVDVTISGPGIDVLAVSAGAAAIPTFDFATAGLDVTMSGLTVTAAPTGSGGIEMSSASSLTLDRVAVTGNHSLYCAVHVNAATITISNSSIVDNAPTMCGGVFVRPSVSAKILNSTISGNTISGFGAGGLYVGSSSPDVLLANSTITGNSGSNVVGGAIVLGSGSQLTVDQSTLTANTSTYADPRSTGGIFTSQGGTVTLSGTILSDNHGTVPGSEDLNEGGVGLPTITSDDSILGSIAPTLTVGGTYILSSSPMLEPLADNGGPTRTMALQAGSPALDAGPDPIASFPGNSFDQRGSGYVRVVNGRVDIGAFEVQEPDPSPTTSAAPTPPDDGGSALPATGSDSIDLAIVGGSLLLGGGALAFAALHRTRSRPAWRHRG